jgi:integrase
VNKSFDKKTHAQKSSKAAQAAPSKLVASFWAAAQSSATTRSYSADIRHFKQNGGAIPATPTMIAEYLANFAASLSVSTLQHRLIAIHRAHTDAGLPSPAKDHLVKRTMQGICRTLGVKQRRVTALMKDDLLEMVVHVERQAPMRSARDKAMLLLGFAGAFRRSELVALTMADFKNYDNGIEVTICHSKTDQEGVGRTVFVPHASGKRCPVKALKDWLKASGISSGPLFLRISRHDRIIGSTALTPQTVALVIKFYVKEMRGPEAARNVAGHSLRAGYCTEAAVAGLQPYQIRQQTGHKSDLILARYIRPANNRKIPSLL